MKIEIIVDGVEVPLDVIEKYRRDIEYFLMTIDVLPRKEYRTAVPPSDVFRKVVGT